MQRFALSAILALIFASSSQGQTSRSTGSCFNSYRLARPNIGRPGTDYDLATSPIASAGRAITDFEFLTSISEGLLKEFDLAWRTSGGGINGHEGVVLIFRKPDGSYMGRSQGISNEYHMFTFRWSFNAVAIVHTHPNGTDPRPGEQDKRLADKYCVPNFTLTRSGMYVYDPATKKTSKVLNGLDWLKLPAYPDELKGWLGSERKQRIPTGF